jgi:hypothetical protein
MLKKAGFADAQMVAETGINSSPKTKGTLVRATKASCKENALASLAQEKPARIQGTGEENTLSESEAYPA